MIVKRSQTLPRQTVIMNNYDQSPFYTSSQQSLELDHHSRGSSSSSSMQTQLLSPLQGSTAMDWSTQQFFGYDGQSNVSSPSFIPDLNALKTGQPAYRAPGLGPQQNYQPAALGIQAPCKSSLSPIDHSTTPTQTHVSLFGKAVQTSGRRQ